MSTMTAYCCFLFSILFSGAAVLLSAARMDSEVQYDSALALIKSSLFKPEPGFLSPILLLSHTVTHFEILYSMNN